MLSSVLMQSANRSWSMASRIASPCSSQAARSCGKSLYAVMTHASGSLSLAIHVGPAFDPCVGVTAEVVMAGVADFVSEDAAALDGGESG